MTFILSAPPSFITHKHTHTHTHTHTQLVGVYGADADKHLFRSLVSSVDFSSDGRNSGKDDQQLQLLIQEANSLITKPNFSSILCYTFEKQESRVMFSRPVIWFPTIKVAQCLNVTFFRTKVLILLTPPGSAAISPNASPGS